MRKLLLTCLLSALGACTTATDAPTNSSAIVGSPGGDAASYERVIGPEDDGTTLVYEAGEEVVVELPSNHSTGYLWNVHETNRTFGYPYIDEYELGGDGIGSAGVQRMIWKTQDAMGPMIGEHAVMLVEAQPWELEAAIQDAKDQGVPFDPSPFAAFSFTVRVQAPFDGVIRHEHDGGTFAFEEGEQVIVELMANAAAGYAWNVFWTDREFAYPVTDTFVPVSPLPGAPTMERMTWNTTHAIGPMIGTHRVKLAYARPSTFEQDLEDQDFDIDDYPTFEFTVEIVPSFDGIIGLEHDGGTFTFEEGEQVIVELMANASAGYAWNVYSTDREFAYPVADTFIPVSPLPGAPTMERMTWNTIHAIGPMIGTHRVKLAYARPSTFEQDLGDQDFDIDDYPTFEFTIEIVAAAE